jgi:hypothetical protein
VQNVLDHDQRAVHDDAEIECAETQQIRGDSVKVHTDERKQKGDRNGQGGEDGGARTSQEEHQHDDNDGQAFEQRSRNRM